MLKKAKNCKVDSGLKQWCFEILGRSLNSFDLSLGTHNTRIMQANFMDSEN